MKDELDGLLLLCTIIRPARDTDGPTVLNLDIPAKEGLLMDEYILDPEFWNGGGH